MQPPQICLALRYLHKEKRIIHRDLTPNNIMLGERDKVTISELIWLFWSVQSIIWMCVCVYSICRGVLGILLHIVCIITNLIFFQLTLVLQNRNRRTVSWRQWLGQYYTAGVSWNIYLQLSKTIRWTCVGVWGEAYFLCLFLCVSPEVVKNEPYGEKADVWAAGCILYQMVTLTPPFYSANMLSLATKVMVLSYNEEIHAMHWKRIIQTF